MTKYLKYFPAPLLDDLVSGRWLPMVGAGMSRNADLPTPHRMPLWADLGKSLENDIPDYSSSGALDSVSAYQHEFGRAKLLERLSELLFVREAQPSEAHRAFCSIPFDIVCTTNFDFLLERGYAANQHYVYPVIDEEQLSVGAPSPTTLLLKLHGDLHHPSRLVATEDDYDGFLSRFPLIATYLANQLIAKTAVFIGYSLDDPDFRQIWSVVSERLGKSRRMAYSINVDAKHSEVTRLERRGVRVINLPGRGDAYKSVLADAFRELRDHVRENVISVSKVTDEESLRELRLPRDATNRLCLFSLPLSALPYYRSNVFPLAESAGFVPITAADVVAPGDNINAKIDSLIDRAALMVVEPGSTGTRAELGAAFARLKTDRDRPHKPDLRLIVVAEADHEAAEWLAVPLMSDWLLQKETGRVHTVRRNGLVEDQRAFLADMSLLFEQMSADLGLDHSDEPKRLLQVGANAAAVISAFTVLERVLRKRVSQGGGHAGNPLRHLVDQAVSMGVIENDRRLPGWIRLRNEAVHLGVRVSPKNAREVVEGIWKLLKL